jgi:hypothetical protein
VVNEVLRKAGCGSRFQSLGRALAVGGVVLALCGALSVAQAQSRSAEQLVTDGLAARRAGNDEQALALFTQAWDAAHTPRARAQMGLAEQALGRFAEAEQHLEEALATADDAWIRQRRESLQQALESVSARLGSLDVRTAAPGATVRINDRPALALPLARPLRVVSGSLVIQVDAESFVSATRTVNVVAGELARETFELVRVVAPVVPVVTPPRVEPVVTPPRVEPVVTPPRVEPVVTPPRVEPPQPVARRAPAVAEPPSEEAGGSVLPVVGGVGIGLGALSAGLGAIFFLKGQSDADRWNDDAHCLIGTATREATCGASRQAAEDAQLISTVSYFVGGGLAMLGLLLVIVGSGGGDDDAAPSSLRAAAASCAPVLGAVSGVTCEGRF